MHKSILKISIRSYLVGLEVYHFIYFPTMHIRAANAIAILCGSTGSPESSLLVYVYVISTKFSFICSNLDWLLSIKQFFTNV